jgi:hypothetical protein
MQFQQEPHDDEIAANSVLAEALFFQHKLTKSYQGTISDQSLKVRRK